MVTLLSLTLISAVAALPGGHLIHRTKPTPLPPPEKITNVNASIVFGDDTSGPHLGAIAPILVPEGCTVMGDDGPESRKTVGDLSLLQSMSGWRSFLDFVRSDLGLLDDEWDKITLADSDFLHKTNGVQSYWCPQLENTTWSWDPISKCTENDETAPILLEGTGEILSGFARATVQLGVSTTIERNKFYEFGTSLELGGGINVPMFAEFLVRHETRWRLSVGVKQSKVESDTITQEISATVTSKNPRASCLLSLTLKTCQLIGKGKVPVLASGWIWFHFPKKIKGHTNWAYLIESILPNTMDRTVFQHLDAEVSSTGRGNASLICDGVTVASKVATNGTNLAVLGMIDPTWPGNALTSSALAAAPTN